MQFGEGRTILKGYSERLQFNEGGKSKINTEKNLFPYLNLHIKISFDRNALLVNTNQFPVIFII